MKSSYISGKIQIYLSSFTFYFIGKKILSQSKWISRFQASERTLGVAEIANFENLATQDILWVSSLFFF